MDCLGLIESGGNVHSPESTFSQLSTVAFLPLGHAAHDVTIQDAIEQVDLLKKYLNFSSSQTLTVSISCRNPIAELAICVRRDDNFVWNLQQIIKNMTCDIKNDRASQP